MTTLIRRCLTVAGLVTIAASCTDAPTGPIVGSGSYVISAMAGQPLPARTTTSSGRTLTLTSGVLVLWPDGGFMSRTEATTTNADGTPSGGTGSTVTGRYLATPGALELRPDGSMPSVRLTVSSDGQRLQGGLVGESILTGTNGIGEVTYRPF